MAKKYGWCCPYCNAFKNSDDKSEVKTFKNYHKRNKHKCDLVLTKAKTLARKSLAEHLDNIKYKYLSKPLRARFSH